MAGHSKWANIQHRKGRQDSKRAKVFTKLIREITVAAKMGGADPISNPRLRTAIDKAFGQNMTKDTIDRAIKRGVGAAEGVMMEEISYEGYGPGGAAVLVECFTDNRNRTVADVRHAFSKCGGNLGTEGSVSYLFHKKGLLTFAPHCDENKVIEIALEAGAEDVIANEDQSVDVYTTPEYFHDVKQAMISAGLVPDNAEITMIAVTEVNMDREHAEKMLKLLELLEELDDVQNVYSNANISNEILAQLSS